MLHAHLVSSTGGWWEFSIIKIFGYNNKNQESADIF